MATKKTRKSLDDALANNFVYGNNTLIPATEPEEEQIEPKPEKGKNLVEPIAKAVATEAIPPQPTTLMSRLMQNTPEKEPTIRLTVDLPQSTHKKLSILCANTSMKKVEVVRMLLDDALKDINT
jgi:hypothetical protein